MGGSSYLLRATRPIYISLLKIISRCLKIKDRLRDSYLIFTKTLSNLMFYLYYVYLHCIR